MSFEYDKRLYVCCVKCVGSGEVTSADRRGIEIITCPDCYGRGEIVDRREVEIARMLAAKP